MAEALRTLDTSSAWGEDSDKDDDFLRELIAFNADLRDPSWMPEVNSKFRAIGLLEENWDSYGAGRISIELIKTAKQILRDLVLADTPEPAVVPTASGGIQIEWHANNINLEFEVLSPTHIEYFFEDLEQEYPSEEKNLEINLGPLTDKIQLITHRNQ